jgi:hypothetical protein
VSGFPNGRRPWDDIVDVELRVAAGVLYKALIDPNGPDFNVAPNNLLADGVDVNDRPFLNRFPFLALPAGGKDTVHAGPVQGDLELPTATATQAPTSTPTRAASASPTHTPPTPRGNADDGCNINPAQPSGSLPWFLMPILPLLMQRRRASR